MNHKPRYNIIDGLRTPPSFVPELLREAMAFKPDSNDIIIATYPKCGTTWTQQIVALILRKGKPFLTADDYFSYLPFLEITPKEKLSSMEKPRCIKTHLPFDRINFSKEAKYIHVARHPADCAISFYHHARFLPMFFFSNGSFDDFFELFIKGEVESNDYFDHLLSWYEHRNEPNILFLTYENMIHDHRGACLQIAQFLGEDHYRNLLDNDGAVLKKVLEYSSLDFMKSTVNKFYVQERAGIPSEEIQQSSPVMRRLAKLVKEASEKGHSQTGQFVRKGAVGEGKISLSEGQLRKLDERIREKTKNSDVMNLWETNQQK